jgi:hypothetical protein
LRGGGFPAKAPTSFGRSGRLEYVGVAFQEVDKGSDQQLATFQVTEFWIIACDGAEQTTAHVQWFSNHDKLKIANNQ